MMIRDRQASCISLKKAARSLRQLGPLKQMMEVELILASLLINKF